MDLKKKNLAPMIVVVTNNEWWSDRAARWQTANLLT